MIIDRLNFYPFLSQGNCINFSPYLTLVHLSLISRSLISPQSYHQLHQGILTCISPTPSGNSHLHIHNSIRESSLVYPQLLQGILTCISPTRLPCSPKFLPDIFYPMLAYLPYAYLPSISYTPISCLSPIRLSPVYLPYAYLPSISYPPVSYPATPNLPTPTCLNLTCPTPTCLTLTC